MYFSFVGRSALLQKVGYCSHEEWEILLNLEGEGTQWIGDTPYSFREGTVFCIPPNTPHAKQSKNGFRDIFIAYPQMPLPKSKPFFTFEDDDRRIEQLMAMIHDIYRKGESNYMDISDHLAEALEMIVVSRINAATVDPRVSSIMRQAVRHFTDPDFSITAAIAAAGYCEDHLRRLFRREIGQTPLEYLTALRINYAKKLICKCTKMHYNFSEIAIMVGFTDISYFSRVFKKSTGLSPRAYMQQNAK